MTKREYKYHLLRKLFKPSLKIPFCGTQAVSLHAPLLTIAEIAKAVKELKSRLPEPEPSIFDIKYVTPVPWDDYEAYLERQHHKRMWNMYFK